MQTISRLSIIEQTAENVREALRMGRWEKKVPGLLRLSGEMGVAKATMRAAMRMVEAEGLVRLSSDGRSREVTASAEKIRKYLRIGILLYEDLTKEPAVTRALLGDIRQTMEVAGFECFFSSKNLMEMEQDVTRIRRYIASEAADAWIVSGATSEVLWWFSGQSFRTLSLFGRSQNIPIAGASTDKCPAVLAATQQLCATGHRNISFIVSKQHRAPTLGFLERAYLGELENHGITPSDLHLPGWQQSAEGFHALLDRLFSGPTPPTALILDETPFFIAALQFLNQRQLRAPEDVSLICADWDPSFELCHPAVAFIEWKSEPMITRILRWAKAVRFGKEDLKQTTVPAKFICGGTVGPARAAVSQLAGPAGDPPPLGASHAADHGRSVNLALTAVATAAK